jgi:hypothetical protein
MWATDKQVGYIYVLNKQLGRKPNGDPARLTTNDAGKMIEQLLAERRNQGLLRSRQTSYSARAAHLERYIRA